MNLETLALDKLYPNKMPLHVATVQHEDRCKVYGSIIPPSNYNKQDILNYITERYKTEKGQNNGQLVCWQSDYFLHKQTKLLDGLIDILNDKVNYFVGLKHGYRLYVSEMWAAVYAKGNYANLHGHGKYCQFSGVLYLQSEEGHPGITFEDNFFLPATENTAYFFDSNYKHSVDASTIDSLRVILGFNFYLNIPK
ncbi:MAG: hypothetical protein EBU90_09795 [Proteobacteria bacterium]|nr:hypothetical protein [Pseudomonadota bacterium]NBP14544.1 hypothetical protein [bacterium]